MRSSKFAELEHDKTMFALRNDHANLNAKFRRLITENASLRRELEAGLLINESEKTHQISAKHNQNKNEATVVAVASDWHIEEEVKAGTVNNLNKFNLDIAKERVHKFFRKIVSLTAKEKQDVKIYDLILVLGGDFISGNIHDELLETCLIPPVEAIIFVQELIESGIDFLLEHTKLSITLPCVVGNHTRITAKVHISTEQGNSLETLMYHSLMKRYKGVDRVRFIIGSGYHIYLPIYDDVFRIHHGHAVNYGGGVGGLSIPLNKAISQWDKTQCVNHDILGHFHTYNSFKKATVNGSLIGYSPFAIRIKAEYEPPTQAFFLWDKCKKKTVTMPIFV